MPSDLPNPETFEAFKNSFSYGSRTDLNFKFLKGLSVDNAAQFLQELLHKLGDTLNDGDLERILDHIIAWQTRFYSAPTQWVYTDSPFTPLKKPVAKAKLALLTSSGHFVDGDDPCPFGVEDMSQEEATRRIDDFLKEEPTLSAIPWETPAEKLRVRHGGYDIRGAQADPQVAFPNLHLHTFMREGIIGSLAPNAYSFMGACAQTRLLKQTGPRWVEMFRQQGIEGAVLVPV